MAVRRVGGDKSADTTIPEKKTKRVKRQIVQTNPLPEEIRIEFNLTIPPQVKYKRLSAG
jgi:hypothetical protein